MDTDVFNTYLKTVKELILDEQKLVTYISLSKDLCIHVNEAKSLLCQIVKDIRNAQPETDLSVCFMISGLLNNNNGCTTVCCEKDIDTMKKTLKIVFYEHVYCVSRGLKSVDNAALSSICKFEDLSLCTGLVKSNSCSKRTDDEIGNLKSKNHIAIIASKSINIQQKNLKDKPKETIKNGNEDAEKDDVKTHSIIKSEIESPKKAISNNNKMPKTGNKSTAKSIAGFFNKVNGNSIKSSKPNKLEVNGDEVNVDHNVQVKHVSISPSNKKVKVEQDAKVKDEPISKKSSIPEKNVPLKNSKHTPNNTNSLTQIKKNAKVDKKRKRLLHVSDSESEAEENDPFTNEMDVDHESEDEIPPTPTVNTVKITSGIVNPKKRRKVVDKTYTDEDGYILTKKEEVYESCSENEEEAKENAIQVKEVCVGLKMNTKQTNEKAKQIKTETSPKGSKNKKKVSPPQKGKQSTINNFFKKV